MRHDPLGTGEDEAVLVYVDKTSTRPKEIFLLEDAHFQGTSHFLTDPQENDRRLALLEQKPDMQLLVGVDRALADDAAWKVLETDHPALAGRLFRFRDFPGVDRVRRVLDAFAETNSGEKKRCRKSMRT